jgi:hypothetical protein
VGPAKIENLNFFSADVERHAIAKRRVRQARPLLVGRRASALHLLDKARSIVVVSDLEDIRVGEVPLAVLIVERGIHKIANGLLDDARNRFALGAADGFRSQGVDDHGSFTRDDDAAAERPAGRERGVHEVAGNDLFQAFSARRLPGRWRLRGRGTAKLLRTEKRNRRKDRKKEGS